MEVTPTSPMAKISTKNEPAGFAGWLFLPLIGVVMAPLHLGYGLFKSIFTPMEEAWIPVWEASPDMFSLLVGTLLATGTLIAFSVCVAWNFFRKTKRTPALCIAFLLSSLVLAAIGNVAADGSEQPMQRMGPIIFMAAIWIPYFIWSKRVKDTFVR